MVSRFLVTGVNGQLGHDVANELKKRKLDYLAPSHSELDISSYESVNDYFQDNDFSALIHCAAWTNVDLAETEEERCRNVNVKGTLLLTEACSKKDIPILFISTDYVFDGSGTEPWRTDDETKPINKYGLSKRDGEDIVRQYKKHFIVRTSWVFGINGKNFVKTMIDLSKKKDRITVVNDQIGSPTYTYDLAPLLVDIVSSDRYGTYHAHNEGYCSWYDFAKKIMECAGSKTVVDPISSENYPSRTKRPMNGRLDTSSLENNGFKGLPKWEDAVKRFIDHLSR